MARPAKSTQKLQQYSLRITADMRAEAKHAGKRMELEDADAFRFAAGIGFRLLRLINYDVESAIVDRAIRVAVENERKKAGE